MCKLKPRDDLPVGSMTERRASNGFTMAVVCWCSGTAVSGCNKNLWSLHTCGVSISFPTPACSREGDCPLTP